MESELIVIAFQGAETAGNILENVREMAERGQLEIEDAVIARRPHEGRELEIEQTDARRGRYAVAGGGIGALLGSVLPVVGTVIGAAIGGMIGALRDRGVDDGFVAEVSDALGADTSALFLLIKSEDIQQFINDLEPFEGRVMKTTLPPDLADSLTQALQ